MAATRLSDVIVPQIFDQYVQQYTQVKSNLIRSGALAMDEQLAGFIGGAGLTFNAPSWKDLDDSDDNISSDDPDVYSTPAKTGTLQEICVRLSRNKSWSAMDLVGTLAGSDPMASIANRVSDYWVRRLQNTVIATVAGVYADNAAAPTGADTHLINDMTVDVKGASFSAGVTNFSTEAFIDATQTMGDSASNLSLVCMHSVVYTRAKKNNLIDFITDSINGQAISIPTFLGHVVIVDDRMPSAAGVFETWLFGRGSLRGAMGTPPVGTEVERKADAGNGGGQDILYTRQEWILHPAGHAYIGTPAVGGPSNANTANNLAAAASWRRVVAERKQVAMARLVTREF
jgi:hypothetical protein